MSTVNGFSVRCGAISCEADFIQIHCMMLHENDVDMELFHIWYRIVLLEFESSERPEGSLEDFPFMIFLVNENEGPTLQTVFSMKKALMFAKFSGWHILSNFPQMPDVLFKKSF